MSAQPWQDGAVESSAESWATPGAVVDKIDRLLDEHDTEDARDEGCIFEQGLVDDVREITRHVRGIHPEWWQS